MNGHDDPLELVNRLDAEMEAVQMTCPHCSIPSVAVIPASQARYALGIEHEPGCPDWIDEDALPVAVVQPRPEWESRIRDFFGLD